MQRWHQKYVGLSAIPGDLSATEIEHFFTPRGTEVAVVARRRRAITRFGLILHIGFLRLTGRTLNSFQILPALVLQHVAAQAGMTAPQIATIRAIYRRRMTLYQHQRDAMDALGFHDFGDYAERALVAHLRREAVGTFGRADLNYRRCGSRKEAKSCSIIYHYQRIIMRYSVKGPDFPAGCTVIFGGAGGLGQAIAGLIAERGSDIVVTYNSREDKLATLLSDVQSMGRKIIAVQCDQTSRDSVDEVFCKAAEIGPVHSVVSAAGFFFNHLPLGDSDPEEFRKVIDLDVIGFFNIAQAGIAAMRKTGGGSFTAIVTTAIDCMVPINSLSSVPKAAVARLIGHIAAEEGKNGIRANAVGPGVFDAGMGVEMSAEERAIIDTIVATTPAGRWAEPQELAEVFAFLASSKASFVTGQIFHCDGGMSA